MSKNWLTALPAAWTSPGGFYWPKNLLGSRLQMGGFMIWKNDKNVCVMSEHGGDFNGMAIQIMGMIGGVCSKP